jgi:hypothetical protein
MIVVVFHQLPATWQCAFNPTNGMPFSFIYTSQESKKCNKFENVFIACSNNVKIE